MIENKGDRVASFPHTFRRREQTETSGKVFFPSDLEIEHETEYVVDIVQHGRTNIETDAIEPFVVTTHGEGNNSFSISKSLIDEFDILPGHSVRIVMYELKTDPTSEFVDDAAVLGRAEVVSDTSNPDNCYPGLYCQQAYDKLPPAPATTVKFRNATKDKQTTAETRLQKTDGRIHFPADAREAIDAEPGDLIEISKAESSHSSDLSQEEKIDQTYRMVNKLFEELIMWQYD